MYVGTFRELLKFCLLVFAAGLAAGYLLRLVLLPTDRLLEVLKKLQKSGELTGASAVGTRVALAILVLLLGGGFVLMQVTSWSGARAYHQEREFVAVTVCFAVGVLVVPVLKLLFGGQRSRGD